MHPRVTIYSYKSAVLYVFHFRNQHTSRGRSIAHKLPKLMKIFFTSALPVSHEIIQFFHVPELNVELATQFVYIGVNLAGIQPRILFPSSNSLGQFAPWACNLAGKAVLATRRAFPISWLQSWNQSAGFSPGVSLLALPGKQLPGSSLGIRNSRNSLRLFTRNAAKLWCLTG